jgi:hypothetical protein
MTPGTPATLRYLNVGQFSLPLLGKAEIRAAVEYLLRGATGGYRGDIVQEIIAIVRDVANALSPKPTNPLDDDMPRRLIAI